LTFGSRRKRVERPALLDLNKETTSVSLACKAETQVRKFSSHDGLLPVALSMYSVSAYTIVGKARKQR
jgi:hypothetical protein